MESVIIALEQPLLPFWHLTDLEFDGKACIWGDWKCGSGKCGSID